MIQRMRMSSRIGNRTGRLVHPGRGSLSAMIVGIFLCQALAAAVRQDRPPGAGAAPWPLWTVAAFGEGDYFYKPSDLEADPGRSRLYVADSGSHRILVFDTDGRFVKAIGREGKGPGEFSRPTGLCVMEDGGIAVADYDNSRIQVFDAAGTLARTIALTAARAADLVAAGDRFYTAPSHGYSGYQLNMADDSSGQPLAGILAADGRLTDVLAVDDLPEKEPFIRAIKHRVCIARAADGTVYLPHFALSRIRVFDGRHKLIATWTLDLPFKPVEPKLMQKRTLEAGVVSMTASLDSVFIGAKVGPEGRLHVLANLESLARAIEVGPPVLAMGILVLDPGTGAVIRTIPCAPRTEAFALIDARRIACIHENDAGEPAMSCIVTD